MKPATISQIKKELAYQSEEDLISICLRLAKYKKENKELLSYLLFETNEEGYINDLNLETTDLFHQINVSHIYYTKKGIRKVLRFVDRFLRYSGNKETEILVRMHFCKELLSLKNGWRRSTQMTNLYQRQLDKIDKAIATLHEDLQYDYTKMVDEIQI